MLTKPIHPLLLLRLDPEGARSHPFTGLLHGTIFKKLAAFYPCSGALQKILSVCCPETVHCIVAAIICYFRRYKSPRCPGHYQVMPVVLGHQNAISQSGLLHFSATWCLLLQHMASLANPFSQYARSKRPADSVHWHAPSVPANLGRRISERMGRLTLGPYWPASRSKCVGRVSRFKCTGQWVSILAHGLVCISIFGCLQDVRHKLTKIVQLIIRSKRLGQPHVQSVWAECHLSSARANGSPY